MANLVSMLPVIPRPFSCCVNPIVARMMPTNRVWRCARLPSKFCAVASRRSRSELSRENPQSARMPSRPLNCWCVPLTVRFKWCSRILAASCCDTALRGPRRPIGVLTSRSRRLLKSGLHPHIRHLHANPSHRLTYSYAVPSIHQIARHDEMRNRVLEFGRQRRD